MLGDADPYLEEQWPFLFEGGRKKLVPGKYWVINWQPTWPQFNYYFYYSFVECVNNGSGGYQDVNLHFFHVCMRVCIQS